MSKSSKTCLTDVQIESTMNRGGIHTSSVSTLPAWVGQREAMLQDIAATIDYSIPFKMASKAKKTWRKYE